jgi:multidrug efflux pump subunit AcrB
MDRNTLMDIAESSIKRSVITWMTIIIVVIGGFISYHKLARYEDPEFTIKEALVTTVYPGATPQEVENEITDKLEKAIQQLSQLDYVESISKPGYSELNIVIQKKYTRRDLPQIWDELRRKVNDAQKELPPGTHPSIVNDDYGDVFGMLFAITGDGFSYKEIESYADFLKKELNLIPGVAKVVIDGVREQAIFIVISRSKIASLGISLDQIYKTLQSQNLVAPSGNIRVGDEYIRISPTGSFNSVESISNLLVTSNKTGKLIHLNDIANITRGYVEVPNKLIYYNGKPALMIGISISSGGNIITIGNAVNAKLNDLKAQIPIGINISYVYEQPKVVQSSIKGFIDSLIQALIIVVAVLLIFMGLRSGLIIGAILLLTILGTFLFMNQFNIALERISLGALIIALGMLVDNAIVVAEGILVKIEQGTDAIEASKEVVKQTIWPLLGATIIGIIAFAPIGLSQDSTGEYTRSLFYVILISLMLSWVFAVYYVPLFCYIFLRSIKKNQSNEMYSSSIYVKYKKILKVGLQYRVTTLAIMFVLLILSIIGFGFVKQSFFPDSTTPMFYINYWRSQGTDIRITQQNMQEIEKYIEKIEGVTSVTSMVGKGALRFMLTYTPEKSNSSYGQFLITVNNYKEISKISSEIKTYIMQHYADSEPKIELIRLGPSGGAKIEVRFSGPDPNILRKLSAEAESIMHSEMDAVDIRNDWRQKVKVIQPAFSEAQARVTGITRADLADALQMSFSGKEISLYRENDKLIPIISRPPDNERLDIENIANLQIWSPLLGKTIPIGQLVHHFNTEWENSIIKRRDGRRTITASCEPKSGLASVVFHAIRPKIEALSLPLGYEMEWGGEYEDSKDAQSALYSNLPMGILGMFIVIVFMFGAIKQPIIIWLCVPLSLIGVTFGLLATNSEFGFMALLGVLSLSGMLIKNAIVLIDQIELEKSSGKEPYNAIIDASISRLRPVLLAAITTVLGMIPLLPDIFFRSMAIVIMFGLTFATLLTLIVIPALYAVFFKVKS